VRLSYPLNAESAQPEVRNAASERRTQLTIEANCQRFATDAVPP